MCKTQCGINTVEILEDTILKHALYVDPNTDYTRRQSPSWEEPFTKWSLNQDPSDSKCNALNH